MSRKSRRSIKGPLAAGAALLAVAVAGVGTGGFGAFTAATSQTQTIETATFTLAFEERTATGDGAIAFDDAVADMIPGDRRERLFRFTVGATDTAIDDITYSVSAVVDADNTDSGIANFTQNAVEDATTANGIYTAIYYCATGAWASVAGDDTTGTDDRHYYCDANTNATIDADEDVAGIVDDSDGIQRVDNVSADVDVETTPTSAVNFWGTGTTNGAAVAASSSSPEFLMVVGFAEDGTTDGSQNRFQTEQYTITHSFSAQTARTAGVV